LILLNAEDQQRFVATLGLRYASELDLLRDWQRPYFVNEA
jgi:hypothetical protein